MTQSRVTPWGRVGDHDGTAAVIAAVLDLDPDATYAEKEIAAAADVSYRDVYLADTVDVVTEMGLLERRDGEDQPRYVVAADHPAYEAARAFADAAAPADASGTGDATEADDSTGTEGATEADDSTGSAASDLDLSGSV